MGNLTIFDYAKMAAQAEQRIIDMMNYSASKDIKASSEDKDLRNSARPHQGQESSG